MTTENRSERMAGQDISQRLGQPDFTGSWTSSNHMIRPGSFRMWVLQRYPTAPQDQIYGERIWGVISDNQGISIFSGVRGGDVKTHEEIIRFVKTYADPGGREVLCKAILDQEKNVYKGAWKFYPGHQEFDLERESLGEFSISDSKV